MRSFQFVHFSVFVVVRPDAGSMVTGEILLVFRYVFMFMGKSVVLLKYFSQNTEVIEKNVIFR